MPIADSRFSIARAALWFGAWTGLAEAFAVYAYRATTGKFVHLSDHVWWMAPAANTVLFGLAGLVLYPILRRVSRQTAAGIAWTTFVILAGLGPALIVQRLHPAAALVLLAGIAIQSGRMVRARPAWIIGVIRRTTPVLVFVVAIIGLGQVGLRELTVRRAEAAQPPPPAAAPNVLLVVLDTVRAASLSLYGYERNTSPNLDRFAREGVVFDHALATSSWTLPSHASMFTGLLPHDTGADWLTPLDDRHVTIAEVMAAHGYSTMGAVANVMYGIEATGLGQGFHTYWDFPWTPATVVQHSWLVRPLVRQAWDAMGVRSRLVKKPAAEVNAEFAAWLDSRPSGRPFFAFLNYFDAHEPYEPPPPFDTKFGTGPTPDIYRRREWSAAEIQRSLDTYEGAVAYVDDSLGRMIEDLRTRGLLDNTLIIITSDHGEQFGEHGLFDHGNALYRRLLEVPLVIRFPSKIPAGIRVPHPVSLVGLPSTIAAVIGLGDSAVFPGESLQRYWTGSTLPATPVLADISRGINLGPWQPVSKGRMRSVVLDGVQYVLNGDGTEELYDFEHDVAEQHNLIDRPEMAAKLEAARRAIGR